MHPDWARSLRDQCQAAGVQFFLKQWGEWWPDSPRIVEKARMIIFGDEGMYRVGKKAAGRELDGRTWDELPRSGQG
jgi:protein gp37